MYDFNYHRPADLAEAEEIITRKKQGVLMSGGMTLIPTMKQRLAAPEDVIDLSGLGNTGIMVSETTVTIKAGTTHAEVATSGDLQKVIPALAGLAGKIGDPQVRYKGTLGGSIANNDPAADYPAALLALDATIITNKRRIAADEFFKSLFETALHSSEIVTAVDFSIPDKAGYAKFPNPASRYAIVGVFVADYGKAVHVAVTGAGPGVFRQKEMEQALLKDFSSRAIEGISIDIDDLNEDIHASAEYRAHLIGVMAKRALMAAK